MQSIILDIQHGTYSVAFSRKGQNSRKDTCHIMYVHKTEHVAMVLLLTMYGNR